MTRRVLITGGSGDIGAALTAAFIREGYEVIFQYHENEARARELSRNLGAKSIRIDFSKDFEPPSGTIDVLINNAAVNFTNNLVAEVDFEDWRKTLLINLTAPIRLCLYCLPLMKENGYGRIINISSIYGLNGSECNGPYNVTKHGLSGLTKSIVHDYGAYGITANEICPGPVDSELLKRVAHAHGHTTEKEIADYFQELAEEIPLKQLAKPNDVANCALFLASDSASYINGVSLPVDGGLIA